MDLGKKIFWMSGGIGNQIFIYAAAIHLQKTQKKKVYFDLRNYNFDFRAFKLDNLFKEVKKANYFQLFIFRPKIIKFLFYPFKDTKFYPKHIEEKSFQSSFDFEEKSFFTYYEGYWQSYIFYKDALKIVKQNYQFNFKLINEAYLSFQQKILETTSVAVHVRRTDYLDELNRKVFNVLDVDYFNNCVQEICETVPNPIFFLFSDDIEWINRNIDFLNHPIISVSNIINNDCQEFDLMRQCKHNIISNSTFSWWAAELNDNVAKIVLAPKIYYKDVLLQKQYASKHIMFNNHFYYR
jgi:hypothetical protein